MADSSGEERGCIAFRRYIIYLNIAWSISNVNESKSSLYSYFKRSGDIFPENKETKLKFAIQDCFGLPFLVF